MKSIVFGTLRRRWLRTLLVGLSALLAFMLLGFFLAIRHGFAVGPVQVGADLLLIEPVGGISGLPLGSLSMIRAFPGVRTAFAINGTAMRFGPHQHPVAVEGMSTGGFLRVSGVVSSGRLPLAEARSWLADPIGALVGVAAADKYGWRIGQTLVLHSMPGKPPRDLTFKVDGVIAKANGVNFSGDVNIHLRYLRRWQHTDSIDFIVAQVTHAPQADAVAHAIGLRFTNSTTPVSTQSFKSLLQGIFERLGNVNALTSVVIVASLFGLFLICFNSVIHSVSERLGEFALLKAVGFAPVRLLWLVFLEAFLVIVPAAAAGMGCAWLLVRAFAAAKLQLPGIALTPVAMAESALIAIGLALLASLLPGVRVARLNCAQVLRKG